MDFSDLPNIFLEDVKGKYFAKRRENRKMNEEMEKLEDHTCPRIQDLAKTDEEMWICSRFPFKQKTTHYCAERRAMFYDNTTCNSSNAKSFVVNIYGIISYKMIHSSLIYSILRG